MNSQTEINEQMRSILVDWIIDANAFNPSGLDNRCPW